MEDQTRKERAQRDYHRMQVTALGPFHFDVMTDGNAERRYRVDLIEPSCTCPDFQKRQIKCKHIYRVELEGYEGPIDGPANPSIENLEAGAPSDPDRWRPDASFTWFDAREDMFSGYTLKEIYCYGAPGKKKDYKFWVGIPNFPRLGILTLYWGDFNEQELQSDRHLGQSKEIACQSPSDEAQKRGWKKLDKGYAPLPFELEELLLDRIATQLAAKGYDPQKVNPDKVYTQTKTEEKPKTNWKPDNEFVWF